MTQRQSMLAAHCGQSVLHKSQDHKHTLAWQPNFCCSARTALNIFYSIYNYAYKNKDICSLRDDTKILVILYPFLRRGNAIINYFAFFKLCVCMFL